MFTKTLRRHVQNLEKLNFGESGLSESTAYNFVEDDYPAWNLINFGPSPHWLQRGGIYRFCQN